MNLDELRALINGGESEVCEFKSEFPSQASKLANEMVALANTNGGLLLLGVADDGMIVGVSNPVAAGERLVGLANACDPPIRIEISQVDNEHCQTVVIADIPCKPITTSNGCVYIRVGTVSRRAGGNEISEIFKRNYSDGVQLFEDENATEVIDRHELTSRAQKCEYTGKVAPPVLIISFFIIAGSGLLDITYWFWLALFLGSLWIALFFLILLPNKDYLKISRALPKNTRDAHFLGDGRFVAATDSDGYRVYTMTADCIYPGCAEGKIDVVSSPQRLLLKNGKEYVGVCNVAGRDHSYRIDYTGLATRKEFDWSSPEQSK